MAKPSVILMSPLTGRVFITKAYKDMGEGKFLVTGTKEDITETFNSLHTQMVDKELKQISNLQDRLLKALRYKDFMLFLMANGLRVEMDFDQCEYKVFHAGKPDPVRSSRDIDGLVDSFIKPGVNPVEFTL